MSITRVNGTAYATELVGRDLKFVKLNYSGIETSFDTVDSNFEKAVKVLEKYSTVTVVGTPASDNAMFVVEGLPTKVGAKAADQSDGTAIASALKADLEASIGSGTATWTVYNGLSGTAFA